MSLPSPLAASAHTADGGRPRVVVAGGGFAALEAILGLQAVAGERVAVELVSLHRTFAYRPAATAEPFVSAPRLEYDLREIARELGVGHRVDRLEAVAPKARRIRLASGAHLDYDFLILAVGAQLRTSIPGALMFTGPRDEPYVSALLDDLDAGTLGDVVFAVPAGVSWPLPVYELALLTAGYVRRHGRDRTRISLVSPERAPLGVLGERGSAVVDGLLRERGVRFLGGRDPERHVREGRLLLRSGEVVEADRVIAAPNMEGRPLTGIPADRGGFAPTDRRGRVDGLERVYAAGDMTAFPIKHGGLATQQADAIVADVAARLGLGADAPASAPVLSVRLVGGARPVELHASLDPSGRALDARVVTGAPLPDRWPGPDKVFGRHLTPYLTARTRTLA